MIGGVRLHRGEKKPNQCSGVCECVCTYLQAEAYITLEATIAVRALPDGSNMRQASETDWQKNQSGWVKQSCLQTITDAAPAAPPPLFTLASKTCIFNVVKCQKHKDNLSLKTFELGLYLLGDLP
jgi:hypothetical protein